MMIRTSDDKNTANIKYNKIYINNKIPHKIKKNLIKFP